MQFQLSLLETIIHTIPWPSSVINIVHKIDDVAEKVLEYTYRTLEWVSKLSFRYFVREKTLTLKLRTQFINILVSDKVNLRKLLIKLYADSKLQASLSWCAWLAWYNIIYDKSEEEVKARMSHIKINMQITSAYNLTSQHYKIHQYYLIWFHFYLRMN